MSSNHLMNESELFCSDLQYKIDENHITSKFVGHGVKRADDLVMEIEGNIRTTANKY